IEQRLVAEMQALLEGYGASDFELRAVPAQDSDADPTLVLLPYRSIYANIEYVESQIRIEFSCRSMKEPRERIEIRPLIAEAYPDVFGELVFPIYAVVPTRTFLEKAFLLHEEFQKENPRVERMTRHLYDLERLMDTDFGKAALADPRMYAEIVRHRSIFNTIRGVDYRTHHPSRIDFIPPEKLAEVWRRDYERMQEYFIYGDSLPYDRLIARMAELRDRFRKVVMEDDFFSES
ncbi:MAG: nucleotidyl transferase AbiEii/AbiGii toxin family protein, partial [Alistipes shahii]